MPVALVTGASRGFGRAVAEALAERGFDLVVDARDERALADAVAGLARVGEGTRSPRIVPVAGDVAHEDHRERLVSAARGLGGLDLLVNNASTLGVSPLPPLDRYPLGELEEVLRTNVVAPLGLVQAAATLLREREGCVVNVTSDAAVEPYAGWGGYGSAKAALDLISAVLGVEQPQLRVYAFDPGDMRTDMHQAAYPGEDISDRPLPETVVPALLKLVDDRPPSGRYTAARLLSGAVA